MHLQGVDLNDRIRAWKVAVGKDSLNWPKIFEAAKVGGLKNYFVKLLGPDGGECRISQDLEGLRNNCAFKSGVWSGRNGPAHQKL